MDSLCILNVVAGYRANMGLRFGPLLGVAPRRRRERGAAREAQ